MEKMDRDNKMGKEKGKKKKRSISKPAVMKLSAQRENPFEVIWSCRKHDMLGKKREGRKHHVCRARSLAIDKRKKTLLKEYEKCRKSSLFVDKRIGKTNDELKEFDKAIIHFKRERQSKKKLPKAINLKRKYFKMESDPSIYPSAKTGCSEENGEEERERLKKLEVSYGLKLQYFSVLANEKPLNFGLLNLLVKPLMEMSMDIPYFAAECARQQIMHARKKFGVAIKNPGKTCLPSMKTLSMLRLWFLIFQCSNFHHVVITPALLLMSEYLLYCPISSGRDIAVGAFLCSMVLFATTQSKKFCPEAMVFIQMLLTAAAGKEVAHSKFQVKEVRSMLCLNGLAGNVGPLNLISVMCLPENSSFFESDTFKAGILFVMVETLSGFIDIYGGLTCFPEVFAVVSVLSHEIAQQENMPAILRDKFNCVGQLIHQKIQHHNFSRQPLQLRKQRPVPCKLLAPKINDNFVKGGDYGPDRERAKKLKLNRLLKREAKGAARELRKDNYFLFDVKQREKAALDEEKDERYGRAKAFLQEQQHAFRSGQLGGGRKRRR